MLYLLLKFTYIALISFYFGNFFLIKIANFCEIKNNNLPFSLTTIFGTFIISIVASVFSIFFPLSTGANIFFFGIACYFSYFSNNAFKLSFLKEINSKSNSIIIFLLIITSLILFYSSTPTSSIDELSYYTQFINWHNHYPVVNGLANLDSRIGFNSNWHVFASLFNFDFIINQDNVQINGFYLLLYILYVTPQHLLKENKINFIDFIKLGFLIAIAMPWFLAGIIVAPSADLIITSATWIIMLFIYQYNIEKQIEYKKLYAFIILFLSWYLITVKFSALVVLLPVAIVSYNLIASNKKNILWVVLIPVIILLPWIIRNYFLSGYLFYPIYQIDVCNVKWKVPQAIIQGQIQWIKQYAFEGLSANKHSTLNISLIQKYWVWFRYNNKIYDQLIILFTFISPLLIVMKNKNEFLKNKIITNYLLIILIASGIFYWLLEAPSGRFGYAYTIPLILISIYPILKNKKLYFNRFAVFMVLFFIIFSFLFHFYFYKSFTKNNEMNSSNISPKMFLLPLSYPAVKYTSKELNNKLKINIVSDKKVGIAPFPYLYSTLNNTLQFRTENYKDGFQIVNK